MITLKETYKLIITEAIALSEVIEAIESRQVCRFYYEGDNTEKKGWRLGEFYTLGDSTAGNKVVRVYQLTGVTDTVIPNWKLFRVDAIRDIEFIRSFSRPRPKFNPNGDKTMTRVYNIAKF